MSGNAALLLWSIRSDQMFSYLIEGSFLNVPINDVPDAFRFFFDKVDIFTYANLAVAILTRVCLSRFQSRFVSHFHPLFHPIQFHLGYPGADRSNR